MFEKIYDLYEDDFKLFGYRPDDALRIAKEKRRRRSQPAIEEFSELKSENFEIFYPDIINWEILKFSVNKTLFEQTINMIQVIRKACRISWLTRLNFKKQVSRSNLWWKLRYIWSGKRNFVLFLENLGPIGKFFAMIGKFYGVVFGLLIGQ